MIEIFICLILVPFYIFKYFVHKSKDDAYEAEIKNNNRVFSSKVDEWKALVTDIETERDVYEIVNDVKKLKKHKKEIEEVLCSEFGMKEGVMDKVFLSQKYGIETTAKEFLSKILMANRNKLRETDAINGIYIGHDFRTYEWLGNIEYINKRKKSDSKYIIEMQAIWINKKLKEGGIDEAFLLESMQGFSTENPSGIHYYLLKDNNDIRKFLNARKEPRKDFSHSYHARGSERLMWGASVRGFYTNAIYLQPIEQYEYWYLK